jgi:hypothetical protein
MFLLALAVLVKTTPAKILPALPNQEPSVRKAAHPVKGN